MPTEETFVFLLDLPYCMSFFMPATACITAVNTAFWEAATYNFHSWLFRNPACKTGPQKRKNPCAVGIAVRCDREVGAIATHLSFSCLIFDPVENPPNGHHLRSERLPETSNSACFLLAGCWPPCVGKADTGASRLPQRATSAGRDSRLHPHRM